MPGRSSRDNSRPAARCHGLPLVMKLSATGCAPATQRSAPAAGRRPREFGPGSGNSIEAHPGTGGRLLLIVLGAFGSIPSESLLPEIGRASCRERVEVWVGVVV